MLEEDIAVLVRAAHYGALGVESSLAESLNSVHIAHFLEILIVPDLDLLDLVRGAEAVEEVDEGNSALDRCKVSNSAEIHNFLRVGLCKHCKAGLTAGVNIGMIAENVKCVGSNAASRYMENAGEKLTGDLIHIGYHEQKALGCSVSSGESTGCERTVNGAGCACLRLHLGNLNGGAEDILETLRRPLVNVVCHGAGRSYRVDTGNFRERIGHICRSVVTVHGLHFSCHSLFPPKIVC